TRMIRTPEPSSTRSRSGNAAPPCDTSTAMPFISPGSVGVTALTVPTTAVSAQPSGLAANVASRHAFSSVVSRDGSCLGSVTFTDFTFAPSFGIFSVVTRLAPLTFEVFDVLDAENDGLNASELQPSTANGVESVAVPPSVDPSVDTTLLVV